MKKEDYIKLFPLNKTSNKPNVWFTQGDVLEICDRVQYAVKHIKELLMQWHCSGVHILQNNLLKPLVS